MTFAEFKASLRHDRPPAIPPLLQAMWHDANGNWGEAHRIAQDIDGQDGAWVHAYLHRKEGDLDNAGYWHARAGSTLPDTTLEQEWEALAVTLLDKETK